MDWSDGYGDVDGALRAEQERSLVEAHYNTARSLAHQMKVPTDAEHFDDVVQEAVVAAWAATQVERRDPVTYGMVAARNRMTGTLQGKHPMYGSEREGGRVHDLHRKTELRVVSEDGIPDIPWRRDAYSEVDRRIDLSRALEGAAGPVEAKIAAGLAADLSWAQIAEMIGTTPNAAQKRWRKVRPALAERLTA